MNDNNTFSRRTLLVCLAVSPFAIFSISTFILYKTSLNEEKTVLKSFAQSEVRLIDSLTKMTVDTNNKLTVDEKNTSVQAVVEVYKDNNHIGASGEIVLGTKEGDEIKFLYQRRFDHSPPVNIPLEHHWAEPMRRALANNTGVVMDYDYRGETVIAGYAYSTLLGIGVVVKRDLNEFRLTYFGNALVAMLLISAICAVVVGLFVKYDARIKKQRAEFQRILEVTYDSLEYVVITTDASGTVLTANRSLKALFGYESSDIIGKNVSVLMTDDHRRHHNSYLKSYQTTGIAKLIRQPREFDVVRKNGEIFPIRLSVSEGVIDDKPIYTGIIMDISEEHQRQREKKKLTDELKRSNEELSKFAYVASHDLRAPLRGIKTTAEWVIEDLGENIDSEIKESLDLMQSRISRLDDLLEALLTYARVNNQQKSEIVNLPSLFDDIMLILSPKDNVHINIQCNVESLFTVKIRLQQVLQNLIDNAIKHNDKSECIIDVNVVKKGKSIHFSVLDNGPGIPKGQEDKIFVVFQRLVRRDDVEGTGIGLSLVKRIVEIFGQDLTVRSIDVDGKTGCEFSFLWNEAESEDVS